MRHLRITGALALIVGLAVTTVHAQAPKMYRWTDTEGKIHYSDKPPMEKQKQLEQRQIGGSVIETSAPGYALQQAMKNYPVQLYTAPNCGKPCDGARELLAKRGVPFQETSIKDDGTRDELQKVSGDTQVPVMTVGREMQKGFETGTFNGLLDTAGYPQSAGPARPKAPVDARLEKQDKQEQAEAKPKGKYLP